MTSRSTLQDYNEIQAQKYAKFREQKDKEEREQREKEEKIKFDLEEKVRLENEEKLLKEMQFFEEFEGFLDQLEQITLEIHTAISIIEIDMTVVTFMTLLESNQHFMDSDSTRQQIAGKVIQVINSISQNENSKFDVTIKDDNDAAKRITENTKTILKLINYDDTGINFELMDTVGDEEVAKNIHKQDLDVMNDDTMTKLLNKEKKYNGNKILSDHVSTNPLFFGNRNGNRLSVDTAPIIKKSENIKDTSDTQPIDFKYVDPDFPDYDPDFPNYDEDFPNYDEFPTFDDNSTTNQNNNLTNNLTYYSGFDNIDDPDLVQMLHYQNELFDDNK